VLDNDIAITREVTAFAQLSLILHVSGFDDGRRGAASLPLAEVRKDQLVIDIFRPFSFPA
jgi:hypothetical protein